MHTTARRLLQVLAVAALLAVAGCGIDHIRALREAEDTFSRAAEQENRGRLASADAIRMPTNERQVPGGAVAGNVSDSTGYRVAAEMAGKLIKDERAKLEEDKLLCTAYVIRAFSLWRLGQFNDAVNVSREGCGDAGATPRDKALLGVVAALVGIDESNARVFNGKADQDEQEKTAKQIAAALTDLRGADEKLPQDHPLRAYLFAARLAALRVASVSPNREGLDDATEKKLRLQAVKDADETLVAYRKYLRCQLRLESDPEHPSVSYWQRLFGLGNSAASKPVPDCSAGS